MAARAVEVLECGMEPAMRPALSLAYAFTLDGSPAAADVTLAAARSLQAAGAKKDNAAPSNSPMLIAPGAHSMTEPAVLRQEEGFCLVWKPPGWEVSVSDGEDQEVYSSAPQIQDWLAKAGNCPIASDPDASHGLIHRLDRDTSGLLLWAPTYASYYALRLAFVTGKVQKEYLCLCHGWVPREPRMLDAAIRRVLQKEPRPGAPCERVLGKWAPRLHGDLGGGARPRAKWREGESGSGPHSHGAHAPDTCAYEPQRTPPGWRCDLRWQRAALGAADVLARGEACASARGRNHRS
ncbi:unnamed protein product [Effrenium voratum]|nr:unnamed protein product [Effrenium voratum]